MCLADVLSSRKLQACGVAAKRKAMLPTSAVPLGRAPKQEGPALRPAGLHHAATRCGVETQGHSVYLDL